MNLDKFGEIRSYCESTDDQYFDWLLGCFDILTGLEEEDEELIYYIREKIRARYRFCRDLMFIDYVEMPEIEKCKEFLEENEWAFDYLPYVNCGRGFREFDPILADLRSVCINSDFIIPDVEDLSTNVRDFYFIGNADDWSYFLEDVKDTGVEINEIVCVNGFSFRVNNMEFLPDYGANIYGFGIDRMFGFEGVKSLVVDQGEWMLGNQNFVDDFLQSKLVGSLEKLSFCIRDRRELNYGMLIKDESIENMQGLKFLHLGYTPQDHYLEIIRKLPNLERMRMVSFQYGNREELYTKYSQMLERMGLAEEYRLEFVNDYFADEGNEWHPFSLDVVKSDI